MKFLAALVSCLLIAVSGGALADGRPYELKGTQVWTVPDPVSGRTYEIFVNLPASYAENADRSYPVLYLTDSDYAFPVVRSITNRVRDDGKTLEDFILIGLSYSVGDNPVFSRNRDYTPTPAGTSASRRTGKFVHGEAEAYRIYLQSEVQPFVQKRFRADTRRQIFMGHSYGALFGAHVLLTEPTMFSDYILGSPSLWYDKRYIFTAEQQYAAANSDLPAKVFLYVGSFETVRNEPRYRKEIDMVGDMHKFAERLKSRNYPGLTVATEVVHDEDHLTVFPSGFTRGLLTVLPAKR
jgi:predicted alpha/beta superfamily hydrolase